MGWRESGHAGKQVFLSGCTHVPRCTAGGHANGMSTKYPGCILNAAEEASCLGVVAVLLNLKDDCRPTGNRGSRVPNAVVQLAGKR